MNQRHHLPLTYLGSEQKIAENCLDECSNALTSTYNAKFTNLDIVNIATSAHILSARRYFNAVLMKRDVYIDSNEINRQIQLIINSYNCYATYIGFANCVGDQIARIAFDRMLSVMHVWPKDTSGSLLNSAQVYIISNYEFRKHVKIEANMKLNFKNTLGALITLAPEERKIFNVPITEVEKLCSRLDETCFSIADTLL